MNHTIADNFLPWNEFVKIQTCLLTANFPWYLNSSKVFSDSIVDDKHNYQFTHSFYDEYKVQSNFIGILDPLLVKINPSAIVRIKANLIPNTDQIIEYDFHQDIINFDGETAVFYINSNNGYTSFRNNIKVDSIENRLLKFNSLIEHTGTSCTDQRVRCVINLNYYNWK